MNLKIALIVLAPIIVASVGCASVSKHELNAPVYELQCDDAVDLKSTKGIDQYRLEFTNSRAWSIDVFWINYNGKEEHYKSISPGKSWSVNTYTTHPWVVREKSGECLALYSSKSDVFIDIK